MREEFLELLRTDQRFREEVRRQLLSEDLLALPGKFDHLTELVGEGLSLLRQTIGIIRDLAEVQRQQGEQMQALIQAQLRTEEHVGRLDGRMDRVEATLERLAEAQQRTEVGLQHQAEQMQALIQAQLRTEEHVGRLDGRMDRVEATLERLAEAQQHTADELQWLADWQRGESGRRDGERYERAILRRAPTLFNGGYGGAPDQPSVQQQLTEQLGALLAQDVFEPSEDPFLADLLWWKNGQMAVVEVSVQVNGDDVVRAARRAATLRRAGVSVLPVVIGEQWAVLDSRERALAQHVEWKVGSDLSEGFLAFRRVSR